MTPGRVRAGSGRVPEKPSDRWTGGANNRSAILGVV